MTTTPKQMTLEQVSAMLKLFAKDLRKSKVLPLMADRLIAASRSIDAEIAKQRNAYPAVFTGALAGRHVGLHGTIESVEALEAYVDGRQRNAEPVAWIEVVEDDTNRYGKSARAYAIEGSMELSLGKHDLYTHPHQRNAAEVTNEIVADASQAFSKAIGFVPLTNDKIATGMRAALSAVASRDYAADEDGLCFVDGLGWVVQCSHAARYIAKTVDCGDVASRDREDAERYRWLRDHSIFCNDSMQEIWFDKSNNRGDTERFDSAIDAARKGEGHE